MFSASWCAATAPTCVARRPKDRLAPRLARAMARATRRGRCQSVSASSQWRRPGGPGRLTISGKIFEKWIGLESVHSTNEFYLGFSKLLQLKKKNCARAARAKKTKHSRKVYEQMLLYSYEKSTVVQRSVRGFGEGSGFRV